MPFVGLNVDETYLVNNKVFYIFLIASFAKSIFVLTISRCYIFNLKFQQ